jgi:hypothetical protein
MAQRLATAKKTKPNKIMRDTASRASHRNTKIRTGNQTRDQDYKTHEEKLKI